MTAIFATPFAPSVSRARSQRRAPAAALLLAALALSACGGLSVRHDDPDAGTEVEGSAGKTSAGTSSGGTTQTHPSTTSDRAACEHVCQTCLGSSVSSCDTFCDTIFSSAQQASCGAALSSLLHCQDTAGSGCSVDACPSQNNSLTVCVLDYCDDHPTDAVCIAAL